MSDQMVESQSPMLVEYAMNFESLVNNMKIGKNKKQSSQTFITWDNAEELENYITKIQEAANQIINENKRLRKIHNSALDTVLVLFDVDLVKQKHVWKDKMEYIRRIVEAGCMGKDPKLCRSWRVHWDFQIYKVLEYQYQKGFETLETNITEISADIILRGGTILLKPPVEELRDRYY